MSTETQVRTTEEVANKLIAHCRQGQFDTAVSELYGENIKSHEMPGTNFPELTEGKQNVIAKGQQWSAGVKEVHSMQISEPLIAGNHFSVRFDMDITYQDGNRIPMSELAVYQVENGEIVNERFLYPTP